MRLAILGTGYVGLVTGTCMADSGNDVVCIDKDKGKIDGLLAGRLPIYEPGLEELVERNSREGRLRFTTDLAEGLRGASVVFICVGTPQSDSGAADLRTVFAVADAIAMTAEDAKLVVVKSTVPVGTNAQVLQHLARGKYPHRAASNPEFLKEGAAIDDCTKPDRVVVGVRDPQSAETLRELYAPFLRTERPFLVMSPESAEMTKYVANAMLATKISFINEMANLCEKASADINDVRRGIGHDARIGFQFLFPGAGYGGSCFPKDIRAVISMAGELGLQSQILTAVDDVNESQKRRLGEKIAAHYPTGVKGKIFAIWGLAFKPRTDDIREAPALVLLEELLGQGARCRVHDPEAMENVRTVFGDRIEYLDRPIDAVKGADALVIVTEWQEFRSPDFGNLAKFLADRVIFDGRNLFEPKSPAAFGLCYHSIGRATTGP
ncbi:MAG: UDP-glucose/GDP-mannose dehydrogenase family protein [Planctomycetota bacterium]|nr:UDP-glucose/GDP-mannose dehydrogenase family protein [Planctomycetota bacterium]